MKEASRGLPAELPACGLRRDLIEEFFTKAGGSGEERHKLARIVEGLLTDTVVHGYHGDSDERIHLRMEQSGHDVTLVYEDGAPPYDPLVIGRATRADAHVLRRDVGGLGAYLLVQLCFHSEYHYIDGRNRITLGFRPDSG